MSTDNPTRSRHDLLARHGTGFVAISALVFDPVAPRGSVFCVHDFAGNAGDFETLGRFLVGNGYRVVCVDLPGRGLSASMSTSVGYNPLLHVGVLAQVIQALWSKRIFLLGKGWGGLISLLLLQRTRFKLAGLIVADVEPNWNVDADPMLAELRARFSLNVPSLEAATAVLRSSPEFEGCTPEALGRFVQTRFRETKSGFTFTYDPQIVAGLDRLGGMSIDLRVLFEAVRSPLLYVRGRALQDTHRATLAKPLSRFGGVALGGLSESVRVHFDNAAELVVLQGFLSTRQFPVIAKETTSTSSP